MNKAGAVSGTIVGLLVTAYYIIGSRFYGVNWFGINTIAAGIFGLPANLIVALVISRLTAAPSQELQEFVDNIRYPKGAIRGGLEE